MTPLYLACIGCLTEVALALIEKGANVDAADKVSGHGMVGLSVSYTHLTLPTICSV